MDDKEFWGYIDQIGEAERFDGRMAPALSMALARLPIPRIVDFHTLLLKKCQQLLSWELWEAAEIIHHEPCSEESFCYFRLWAISRGESVFENTLANPDSLAEHSRIAALARKPVKDWTNDDFPHMEDMLHVSEMAHNRVVSKLGSSLATRVQFPGKLQERPREIPTKAIPADFGDERRIRQRHPRLIALFSWP
jgi:hypothetical protein